jgi:hypothetical protein
MDEPKTRREKKGRDKTKTKTNTVYSAKHVREHERLQAKKQAVGEKKQVGGEKTIKK